MCAIWLASETIGITALSSVSSRIRSRRYSCRCAAARCRKTSITSRCCFSPSMRSCSSAPGDVMSSSVRRSSSFSWLNMSSIPFSFSSSSCFSRATSSSTFTWIASPSAACSSCCAKSQSITGAAPPASATAAALSGSATRKTCELPRMSRSLCASGASVCGSSSLPLRKHTAPGAGVSSSARAPPPSGGVCAIVQCAAEMPSPSMITVCVRASAVCSESGSAPVRRREPRCVSPGRRK